LQAAEVLLACPAITSQTLVTTQQLNSFGPGLGHPLCPARVPQQHCFEPLQHTSPPSEK
jgi:hypothetical protein